MTTLYFSDDKSILSTPELSQAGSSVCSRTCKHPQQRASLLSSCLTSWPWPTLPPRRSFLRFHGISLPLLLPRPFLLHLSCWFLHLLPVSTLGHSLGLPSLTSVCCPWISWFRSCPNIPYVQTMLIFVISSDLQGMGVFISDGHLKATTLKLNSELLFSITPSFPVLVNCSGWL